MLQKDKRHSITVVLSNHVISHAIISRGRKKHNRKNIGGGDKNRYICTDVE